MPSSYSQSYLYPNPALLTGTSVVILYKKLEPSGKIGSKNKCIFICLKSDFWPLKYFGKILFVLLQSLILLIVSESVQANIRLSWGILYIPSYSYCPNVFNSFCCWCKEDDWYLSYPFTSLHSFVAVVFIEKIKEST